MATEMTPQYFHTNPLSPARERLLETEQYFLAGNLNEALAAAQQAWREYPREPDVYRVVAYIHMMRGEYPPAAQAAYEAVKIDSNNPASYATLAQVYLTFHMLQLAEETLRAAHERFPQDLALNTLLADVYFRRGQSLPAEHLVSECLSKNPHDAYAKALLGQHLLRKKRYEEAAFYLVDAVQAYPSRWDYLRDCGIAQLHAFSYAPAVTMLWQSLQQNPDDLPAKHHLFLGLQLERDAPWHWQVAFYFFRHSGFGWLLIISGLLAILIGIIWDIIAAVNAGGVIQLLATAKGLSSAVTPTLLLLCGFSAVILPWTGTLLTNLRGDRFESQLTKLLDQRAARLGTEVRG